MNGFIDSHWYRLTRSVIVFGAAGLLFYTAMLVGSFVVKYGLHPLQLLKGLGL